MRHLFDSPCCPALLFWRLTPPFRALPLAAVSFRRHARFHAAANAIFRLSDTRCDASEWQAESGQLLARKSAQGARVHAVLLAAEQMQLDSEFWFSLSGGDKDTFVSFSTLRPAQAPPSAGR